LRNRAEAEDAVQQIFLDVFRSIQQFDSNKGEFKTWLLMLLRSSGTLRAIWTSQTSSSRPTTRSHLLARQLFRMLRAARLQHVRQRPCLIAHLPIPSEMCSIPDSDAQLRTS
jgi:hypothetical protein